MSSRSADPDSNASVELDLSAGPAHFFFSEGALRHSANLNLVNDGRIRFHIKYVPLRGGFVVNESRSGRWGSEIFLETLRPLADAGLRLALRLVDGRAELTLPGHDPQLLDERFDLTGTLNATLPAGIRHGEPARLESAARLPARPAEAGGLQSGWDALVVSDQGFFLEGWLDDRRAPVTGFVLAAPGSGGQVMLPAFRTRRPDVDQHLQPGRPREFGTWTASAGTGHSLLLSGGLSVALADGSTLPVQLPRETQRSGPEFFEFLLAHFGRRNVLGHIAARSFHELEAGHGAVLEKLHAGVAATRAVRLQARYGETPATPRLSLVCVLFGIPDFLYLLVSQFARFGTPEGLEFVFVSNSPELEEVLLRDAELASFVFGVAITVVVLNQNCGFSHANNIGVEAARARAIAIVNPDVFPRDGAAVAHLLSAADDGFGADIHGGKLYYADGSVMHEGMFFQPDRKLSALAGAPVITVEHFRKGFADTTAPTPRNVPAVTGALMLLDRALYEQVGGFDAGYIFGHYEDADLCLRIRRAGGRVVLDPRLAFWHYEGVGSVKRPEHQGSALYNRWRFSKLWGAEAEALNHG
jgi:GT2 family glycosyltransferase